MSMRYFIILISLFTLTCQSRVDQEKGQVEQEISSPSSTERPGLDFTIWTDKTELFVEFPALIVGETSRFAAHFTVLDRHQAVREGSVTVRLINEHMEIKQSVEAPSSPGIFTPSLQPKESGVFRLVFDLETPNYSDQITLNNIEVYASMPEAINKIGGEAENGGAITFLKEQAWKIEFQTTPVVEKEVYDIIPTSGVWKVAPSEYQTLVATTSGRIDFTQENLTEGSLVKKGQVLMTISSAELTSNNLSAEIQRAKAEFEQAKSEYIRKTKLYETKIVPKAEFEQVEQKYKVTKTNYETLSAGYSAGGKQVIVPFDGFIKSIAAVNGQYVEQGASLVMVTSHKSSLLEAQVSPSFAPELQEIQDLWYQPKEGVWSSLHQTGGRILSVGKEVESYKPLLSVFAKVNEEIEMPEGSFTEVQLAVGTPANSMVIPISALLEDYGNYSVIVQLSGESFERRNVAIGKRNGSEVEIKQGLRSGDVVVSTGAYQVKMASMSGLAPAHGHEH